jgi:UDP-3-O-[3-hydroxymyristoyl] N-acetylglucosamine deacetylase
MSSTSLSQRTLTDSISCQGVGLHTGAIVNLTMKPAPSNHGIVFVRTDLPSPIAIPARAQFVVDTAMATTLGRSGVKVGTVEHVLAALIGLGIDNVRIELDGPEVPIMDGSAAPFAYLIRAAGVRVLQEPKSFLVIKKPVSVVEGGKEASFKPSSRFKIDCTIQSFTMEFSDRAFSREIARARTFGFLRDVEMLKKVGLAKGGSLDNAIVVDEFSILNPDGLRFPDEFVRHKVLDAMGDLALFGCPVIGHLTIVKAGHALHHKLVQRVFADSSQYTIVRARKREVERLDPRLPDFTELLEPSLAT